MKKLAVLCLWALWIPNGAAATEAAVKLAMQKRYPDLPVESVAPTPIAGLYEVFTGGEVLYVDNPGPCGARGTASRPGTI